MLSGVFWITSESNAILKLNSYAIVPISRVITNPMVKRIILRQTEIRIGLLYGAGVLSHTVGQTQRPVYFQRRYQSSDYGWNERLREVDDNSKQAYKCCKLNEYFCISCGIVISALDGVVTNCDGLGPQLGGLILGRRRRSEARSGA